MENVALPRCCEETTPTEATKDMPRRKVDPSSDDDHERLVHATQASRNYNTITQRGSSSHEHRHAEEPESTHGHHSDGEHDEAASRDWIGKRLWNSWKRWEEDHLELKLENTQSVARDHLGIPFDDLYDLTLSE
jgi:hypothetical protein